MKSLAIEPIAITGMSCRFPGAPSLREFWSLLSEGRDGMGPVPTQRWDADALFDADPKAPGKTNSRRGGFIENVDRFDAAFFGISPREAAQMDPQQRILLEIAYEAIEDAGLTPTALAGTDTAVFIGAMTNDYFRHQLSDAYRRIDVHTGSGAGLCMLANRLSYQFDLRGPSATVDTACSSSLVAVFQACQSLWTRQSSLALAGGVNVMLDPAFNVFYAKAGLSAPDGRCKTFSAAADGIGRGEGGALIVLKRLADAIADRDPIYAVIRGGAVNHDGRSNGLTQPNRWAQEQLLRQAFQHAAIDPRELQYIELHGTGTLIGDPIEANALGAVLNEGGERPAPCLVGSVKTNLGHLEAAAGVAGVVKLALSISQGAIPPSLWFDAPNPHIAFELSPLRVNAQLSAWPVSNSRRLGGVSSFGLGGTNAHLVLESAPEVQVPTQAKPVNGKRKSLSAPTQYCLFLSARSEIALKAQAAAYARFLAESDEAELSSVCATALARKAVHDFRLSALGTDATSLIDALNTFASGADHPRVIHGRCRSSHRQLVLAVPPMSRIDLQRWSHCLAASAALRDFWNECRTVFFEHSDLNLPAAEELSRAADITPDQRDFRAWHFCVQYCLLKHALAGVGAVEAVVADGLGQLAALSAADAVSLSAVVHWLAADLSKDFPVALPQASYSTRCDFDCGTNPSLRQIEWHSTRSWAERIQSSAHYPNADVWGLSLTAGDLPTRALDAGEWFTLCDESDAWQRLFAHLSLRHSLNWCVWANGGGFIRLPAYPWQRESFWLTPLGAAATTAGASSTAVAVHRREETSHPLLGWRADVPAVAWQNQLNAASLAYLPDHRVQGSMVLPGAGYVEIGLAVHREVGAQTHAALAKLEFHHALVIEDDQQPLVHVSYDEETRAFSVYSQKPASASWQLHARGQVASQNPASVAPIDLADLRQRCTTFIDGEAHYRNMAERGFGYGPYFQGVRELWLEPSGERVLARIEGHEDLARDSSARLHPTLFDAALQSLLTTLTARGDFELYIPIGIDELQFYRSPGTGFWCYGGLQRSSQGVVEGEIVLFDDAGNVIARAAGVRAQALTRNDRDDPRSADQWLYEWTWRLEPSRPTSVGTGRWLAFVHDDDDSIAIAQALTAAGASEVVQVHAGAEFQQHSRSKFTVRADRKSDLQQLLGAIGDEDIAGVVYCWAVNTPAESSGLPVEDAGTLPVVHLLQLLSEPTRQVVGRTPAQIVVVTRGLQSVPLVGNRIEPVTGLAQAALLGLVRVAVNEYADLSIRTIDIAAEAATFDSLAKEIVSADTTGTQREDEIALRGHQRFVHRMVRVRGADLEKSAAHNETPTTRSFDPHGTYVITGGFGGFGLEIAAWMVSQGARHLTLVGRSGAATSQAQQAVERLQARGVTVLSIAADVSREADVVTLLERIRAEMPPLKGIFHAAAALDDAPINHLEARQIDTALGAKARGAWHLHHHTLQDRLDHFVSFSSIASMVGGAGQASYAMACSYLDCLSRYRRARGLPAVSINWGALGQVGMATRFGDVEKYLSGSGVGLFTPLQAIQLLERVLSWNPVELAVAKMDWERWAALYSAWARSAKYADLLTADPPSAAPAQETQFRAQLLALSPAARTETIVGVLMELLAQTMETTSDQIDRSVPLPSLGLDSLMAMDLQLAIEKSFGVKVPMLALMKGNNAEQLAQQVSTSIATQRTEPAAATAQLQAANSSKYHELPKELDLEIAERMIAKLDDFADEEVDRMLEILTREEEIRQ